MATSKADVYRIAGEAGVDWRTVVTVLAGGGKPSSRKVVLAAADKLGIRRAPAAARPRRRANASRARAA